MPAKHSMDDPLYRDAILAHARHPHGEGQLKGTTHSASGANPRCGDRCTVSMKIQDNRIAELRWQGEGCALMTAALSIISERFADSSIDVLQNTSDDEFLQLLGVTVSSGRLACVIVPLTTARTAVSSPYAS